MTKWRIVDTGVGSAQGNMDIDKKLLEEIAASRHPLLHFYEWEGRCATHGYFAKPTELLNMEAAQRWNLQLGRRPTGGGVIFHLCDFAFSIVIPSTHPRFSLNTLENYAFINHLVIQAIESFSGERLAPVLYNGQGMDQCLCVEHFCMAKPTQYDVMIGGRKVGGAAQRRTKEGFLHQGSISLAMPPRDMLEEVLFPESKALDGMRDFTYTLLEGDPSPKELQEARHELRRCLASSAYQNFLDD